MAYETALGRSIVPSADLADSTADVNLQHPQGIGKRKGMLVYRDTGTVLELYMAQGSGATDKWTRQTETTPADVTPA